MTTLAYKDGVLAADTQLSDSNVLYRVQKIDKLEDGSLIGGCGQWDRCHAYIQWLKAGGLGEPPKLKGATLMRITPDGVVWFNDGNGFYPILNKTNVAIGSGGSAAMSLMEAGMSAVDAVKNVSSLDPNTSSPVQMFSLDTPVKKRASRKKSSIPAALNTCSSDRGT